VVRTDHNTSILIEDTQNRFDTLRNRPKTHRLPVDKGKKNDQDLSTYISNAPDQSNATCPFSLAG